MPTPTTTAQHCTGGLNQRNWSIKINKRYSNWKGKSKTLFADDMTLWLENPKEFPKKTFENKFNKDIRSTYKNPLYFYTVGMNIPEMKFLKKNFTYYMIKNTKKYKFNRAVQNLYSENYKILLKEIKEDLNKWKDIPFSWMRRFHIKVVCVNVLNHFSHV